MGFTTPCDTRFGGQIFAALWLLRLMLKSNIADMLQDIHLAQPEKVQEHCNDVVEGVCIWLHLYCLMYLLCSYVSCLFSRFQATLYASVEILCPLMLSHLEGVSTKG